MKRTISAVAAAAVIALAAVGWLTLHGGKAPASTFVLLDGSRATTADLRGKVALVNFWSTSCNACISDMDWLVATYEKYHAKGYETLAVALGSDSPSNVALYSETRHLPFKVALDTSGSVAKAWDNVGAAPTTFLLDRNGAVVKRYTGEPDFAELQRLIEKLLAA
jgi:peroxiredoxin